MDLRRGPGGLLASQRARHLQQCAGVLVSTRRGAGTSASNPPSRYARVHRSSEVRDTRTHSPSGPMCSRAANSRARAPRSRFESALRRELPDQRVPEQPHLLRPVVHHHLLVSTTPTRPASTLTQARPRRIVLIHNNHPPVSADTHDHAARRPSTNDAARVHTPIASKASSNSDPPATAGSSAPSSARAHRQKCAATSSARERNRASQSLTVSAGRSSSSAIRRYPTPARQHRRADHLDRVTTPQQAHIRQQHMRRRARRSRQRPRRGRSHRTPSKVRNRPPPSAPPPAQNPPPAPRAHQPARSDIRLQARAIVCDDEQDRPSFGESTGPLATPAKDSTRGPNDNMTITIMSSATPPDKIRHHPACR